MEREILFMVQNYYGKGATIQEARKNCRELGGDVTGKKAIYDVPKGCYINDFAELMVPRGETARLIG